MEVKRYGPLDFTEVSEKVKIIDEGGEEHADVELHAFVSRGATIIENLRERFKTNWNQISGKEEAFFQDPNNRIIAQSLLKQYAIVVMLIEKVESVVQSLRKKLESYNKDLESKVVKAAVVMRKSDVERIIQEYSQFASTIRSNYLTEGKTNLLVASIQTSTRLIDRHNWLKEALSKWEKDQKK
ncbi:MAG: hypothetical protein JSS30_03945 [Verrucomicrobia bacterium]|nr:hypothetical protein [Verrucomicrobiota bacterium]